MNKENISCCFSEVNELGKHITNCNNLPTKLDKDNVQVRYFCEEHMIKVKNIRTKMAQKYINEYKQKIINGMSRRYNVVRNQIIQSVNSDKILYLQAKLFEVEDWIEKIEKGEFDND